MHPARIPSYTLAKVRKLDRCKDERRQSCKCLVAAAPLCRGYERDINCAHLLTSRDPVTGQSVKPFRSRSYNNHTGARPTPTALTHLSLDDILHDYASHICQTTSAICTSAQCSSPRQSRYASVARVYVVLAAVEVNLNEVRRPFISMAASQPPPIASASLTPRRPQNAT